MEQVILRFPHLAEKIFAQLDNLSLAKCREVSKTWKSFLDQQKFLHIRCIQSYIENEKKDGDLWKKFFKISNTEMILLLKTAVENVYSNNALDTIQCSIPAWYSDTFSASKLYSLGYQRAEINKLSTQAKQWDLILNFWQIGGLV